MSTNPAPSIPQNYPLWFTILVVEDDEEIRNMLMIALTHFGVRSLHVVPKIEEAKKLIPRVVLDMIISDVNLPDGSGKDLLDEVTKKHPCTYRVLISGRPENLQGVTAHRCLAKPFSIDALSPMIHEAYLQAISERGP